MDKLVKLLNEYEREMEGLPKDFEDFTVWNIEGNEIVQSSCDLDSRKYFKYYIISKDYQFIKWLVENDKINIEKLLNIQNDYFRLQIGNDNYNSENYFVDGLLMLLAIQDEPIDFLIEILK